MKQIKHVLLLLLVSLIMLGCGAVVSLDANAPTKNDSVVPASVDTIYSTYYQFECDGKQYIRAYGNCASFNQDFDPCKQIEGVMTSKEELPVIYTVYYSYHDSSRVFSGTIEKCMMFGFDANDIILWSNL